MSNLEYILVLIIFLLISLLIVLLFIIRKKNQIIINEKKAYIKQLEDLNIKNESFSNAILSHEKELEEEKEKVMQKTVDLLVLNRALRENFKLHDGLTSMIVHDLKNPISNIINLSKNKEVLFFANEILTMVENILDVKKYEGMLMPLKLTSINLKNIVDDAIKQIALFGERKNLKIINKINKSITVNADQEIIKRTLVNFLSNSIKYSFANGKIIIDYELKDDNSILVKIIDEGIGITHDKIHLIFNKFSQILAKKTGSARSTGLGLTFCKMAMQSHGSDIYVESKPNESTSFSFLLENSTNTEIVNTENVQEQSNEILNLTNDELLFLGKYYDKLKKLQVYEISELKVLLEQINDNESYSISLWKNKLNDAIFNCNVDLYKELISTIEMK